MVNVIALWARFSTLSFIMAYCVQSIYAEAATRRNILIFMVIPIRHVGFANTQIEIYMNTNETPHTDPYKTHTHSLGQFMWIYQGWCAILSHLISNVSIICAIRILFLSLSFFFSYNDGYIFFAYDGAVCGVSVCDFMLIQTIFYCSVFRSHNLHYLI